jgi:hypothetical protein
VFVPRVLEEPRAVGAVLVSLTVGRVPPCAGPEGSVSGDDRLLDRQITCL